MLYSKMTDKLGNVNSCAARALGASASAAQSARDAARIAGMTVGDGVYTARKWAAPQLENAADYCTMTVAPRVSSALRTTARQVRPEDPAAAKSRLGRTLSWPFLVAAVLAAAGATAAVVLKQRRRTTERASAGTEAEADGSTATAPGSAGASTAPESSVLAQDASTDASVNGRVSSSGW